VKKEGPKMRSSAELIQSGIVQLYFAGLATPEEVIEIETLAATDPEMRATLDNMDGLLEQTLMAQAVEPPKLLKPFVMASLDYMGRLEAGETPTIPPILTENSTILDFAEWLNRPDMVLPNPSEDIYAKIIGYTPEAITAIAWLKDIAPDEVHHNQSERFLIIEGSCEIIVNETDVHPLYPGDLMVIPLHSHHRVHVTSDVPCKVILQRVAV
jgi:mannose-6-phosphate isomerase-like protein (cupin superfamily)